MTYFIKTSVGYKKWFRQSAPPAEQFLKLKEMDEKIIASSRRNENKKPLATGFLFIKPNLSNAVSNLFLKFPKGGFLFQTVFGKLYLHV
jgi:hypothetical protein